VRKRWFVLPVAAAAAGATAAVALSTAPPVGPLPKGPVKTAKLAPGGAYAVVLPKPSAAGRVWRVARAFDSAVVRQLDEATTAAGVRVRFRAVGPGTTSVVFALTRGETAHAYAARTFRFVVAKPAADPKGCPTNLLPLTANPIGPAVTAALVADEPANRPQVTGAVIAPNDTQRGPQAKAQCGKKVWQRTVVVYIVDRAFLPAESASQRVLFVGRTSAGYTVWSRAH
jgi:hypothetical protein